MADHEPSSDSPRFDLRWIRELTFVDLAMVGMTLVGLCAVVPQAVFTTTPRAALTYLVLPLGLFALLCHVRERDRSALVAMGLIVSLAVSTLLSPAVWPSFIYLSGWQNTFVAWVSALSIWALARSLTDAGRRALVPAVLLGLGCNGLIAVVQVVGGFHTGYFSLWGGRATGLMHNPVYLGSAVVAGAGICAARVPSAARWFYWAGGAGLFTFFAGLTSARSAVGSCVVVALAVLLADRSHRSAVALGAVGAGIVLSSRLTAAVAGVSATARVGDSGGWALRARVWRFGIEGLLERPVFGWGPGHFVTAFNRHVTPTFVATSSYSERVQVFGDPHNLAVNVLVCGGIVGFALAAWWLCAACRGAVSWPLMAGSAAIALTWLFEPATLHSLPLAMALFGAAVRPAGTDDEVVATVDGAARSRVSARHVALGLGIVLAVYAMLADWNLGRALDRSDLEAAEAADGWFPPDSRVSARVLGLAEQTELAVSDEDLLRLAQRVVDTDSTNPRSWARYAIHQLDAGDVDGARESIDRAFALQPSSPSAALAELSLAETTSDPQLLAEAERRMCLLFPARDGC